jgi:hypothetical protein
MRANDDSFAISNRVTRPDFTSTAESALAEIAAMVPVGSGPAPSHKMTEPRRSFRACGTYLEKPGDRRTYPGFSETQHSMNLGHVPQVGEPIPYLSPVRFLPSIMTLLNIRLIRVW